MARIAPVCAMLAEKPKGAFYIFPNISKYKMTSEEFATDLLNKEHVVVVPGTAFGESGEGFLEYLMLIH